MEDTTHKKVIERKLEAYQSRHKKQTRGGQVQPTCIIKSCQCIVIITYFRISWQEFVVDSIVFNDMKW
jgi:hypothetical protein